MVEFTRYKDLSQVKKKNYLENKRRLFKPPTITSENAGLSDFVAVILL
jgi:hypothetical protein